MRYSEAQAAELVEEQRKVRRKHDALLLRFIKYSFKNSRAREYAHHGFMRRIGTLARCIENIYIIYPPARTEKLSKENLTDLTINLQSFIVNVYGCVDNLGWIWVCEKEIKEDGKTLSATKIGLWKKNSVVRQSFSQEFQEYLVGRDDWFGWIQDFRHSLGHRIPLYVPPAAMNEQEVERLKEIETENYAAIVAQDFKKVENLRREQELLGKAMPLMTHSFSEESKKVFFHAQVLADWNTVVELSDKFLSEF
ncbi:hypothetical protein [Ferrovibrio sp.]|uniref:hypothetical protein n=1 Tax=Ferrovibrio sp. TaxID=1917215 RepID=UPI00311ECC2E